MKLNPIESSNIQAIGQEGSTVHVQFNNGATYEYTDVDCRDIDGLFSADSVGSFFNGTFRKNNKGVKLEEVTEPVDGLNGRASSDAGLQAGETAGEEF
jgi:hypothetical protein